MYKTFISIAWRSIWRNKRRSILTISMMSFGLFLCIVMEALSTGSSEEMFKTAIDLNLGSIQIHAKDYQENQTLNESFESTPKIEALIKQTPEIKRWAPRIVSGGMVSVGDNTNIANIIGIDPHKEKALSTLKDKIMTPQYLAKKYPTLYPQPPKQSLFLSDEPQMEIIIGDRLADKLEAKIGDDLAAMGQGADGSTGSDMYKIIGVYHTGTIDLDNGLYMHIQEADELLSMYGQVSLISVKIPQAKDIPKVLAYFQSQLPASDYEVMSWRELAPELIDILALDRASGFLFMAVLLLIIGFGVLNTVFMTIMERVKEFGVLKALGTTPQQIFSLVIFETLFLSGASLLAGNILGAGVTYYFKFNPIDMSAMGESYESMGMSLGLMPASPSLIMFVSFSALILSIAFTSALYPAFKAARMEPLDALKHT